VGGERAAHDDAPVLSLRMEGRGEPLRQSALPTGEGRARRIHVHHLGLRTPPRAHDARHDHAAILAPARSGHRPRHQLLSRSLLAHQPSRIEQVFFPFWAHFDGTESAKRPG
jgi:hypothetical protein